MAATADAFTRALVAENGYREPHDLAKREWTNNTKYGEWYGLNGVAWCAIFMSWGANQVGGLQTIVPKFASCGLGLNWFRSRGLSGVFPPRRGDIGFVMHNNSSGNLVPKHVFAVRAWTPSSTLQDTGTVQTVEGNTNDDGSAQGNGVYLLNRRDSRSNKYIVYVRPKWLPDAPPVRPAHTPAAAPKPSTAAPKPIPAPMKYSNTTAIRINDEDLRLGKLSTAATAFNPRVWSWLYWQGGSVGRAHCQSNYAAWVHERSNLFGPEAQRAMRRMYAILNAIDERHWPDEVTVAPPPAWPGAALLRTLGLSAD